MLPEAIAFDTAESELKDQGKTEIDQQIRGLILDLDGTKPTLVSVARGYTDGVGTPDYNHDLARRRADATLAHVRSAITSQGLPSPNEHPTACGISGLVPTVSGGLPAHDGIDDPARRVVIVWIWDADEVERHPERIEKAKDCG